MALLELQSSRGSFLIETTPGPGLAGVSDASPDKIIGTAVSTLEDVLQSISRIGMVVHEKLSDLEVEQGEVTLGVKFSAKGGFFFAEVAGEATLTVKLTFKGKPS